MNWMSDKLVQHLRTVVGLPDLSGTKYRLVEKFSRGGMGTIYLVEDTQLDRRVALKVLHALDASGELAARMLREARVIAKLEHPSIVPVHDVGALPDGRVFYVMKFVQGQRLDQYADAENSLPNRLRIFQKVCEAVAFAHANGVIHRDLKPENIMVGAFGEALVMDWGLAKIVRENSSPEDRSSKMENGNLTNGRSLLATSNETQHGTVMGTPAYMAPEQRSGEIDQIDQRTDVYALGVILKFLLNEQNKIQKSLAAICAKAMAAQKIQRYASAFDLAHDVERFLNGLAVSSYKENIIEKIWRWLKQYRFIVLLVLVYLLVRVLLIILLRR